MRHVAMILAASSMAAMARMPITNMADESGKSQATDPDLVNDANLTTTDTGVNPAGSVVATDAKLTDEQFQEPITSQPADETSAARITADVVPPEYRERYAAGNGTCGDFIATEVSAMTKEGGAATMKSLKAENGIPEGKWDELNNGMQRMNLANVLRGSFLRGEPIKIGGKEYSLAASLVEFEGEGDEREPIKLDNDKELSKFIKMMDMQDTDRVRAALRRALGPKPEKKAVKTAEEREAEKKAKADEREAAKKAKADERAKAKETRDAEKKKAADEREAAKKKAADDREAAKKSKADKEAADKAVREKAAAEKKAATEKAAAERAEAKKASADAAAKGDGQAKDNVQKVGTAVANAQAGKGEAKKGGATK